MLVPNGVIERIAEGGFGGEAVIEVELRTVFPGLGGTIVTHEGVAAALRIERNSDHKSGHKMFLRHLIAKKLDDYFYRTGVYVFSHVPRVLGSISDGNGEVREAYIYEWAFGADTFSWIQHGSDEPIILHDWNKFVNNFNSAGLDLGHDVTDAEDGRCAQNIIHQYPCCLESGEMCSFWKRIDYGYRSIIINPDRLFAFLHDRRNELIEVLQNDRYQMLQLAVAYLFNRDAVSSYDVGRLEQLICAYRRSSLQHYAYGFGPAGGDVCIMEDAQSLL